MEEVTVTLSHAPRAPQPATAIRPCRHGHLMYLRGDRYVGRCLELYGEYSEAEVLLFQQILRPGHVVVEAGANIGSLTVPIARMVGSKGRVVALEPQRAVHNVLCANLALNGLLNVDALRAAAGREVGEVDIPLLGYDRLGNFGGVSVDGDHALPKERVPLLSVDSLPLKRLDLLKVDVEGYEADVLAGARETLARLRPALFVENDRREHSPRLIQTLQDAGYRLWWHLSPLYRQDNFNANADNVMGDILSINMLGLPVERKTAVTRLRPVQGPDDWWK